MLPLVSTHCAGADRRVCGASIQTYLLEMSRVVHHAAAERSFHIFYQVCALHLWSCIESSGSYV